MTDHGIFKETRIKMDNITADLKLEFAPTDLLIRDLEKKRLIQKEVNRLVLTNRNIEDIRQIFFEELENGLREQPSSLQMENTYIPELPNGTEEGKFLALDLGGTNFRILLIELKAGEIANVLVQRYDIIEDLRLGSGTDLFDFIADCVCDFLKKKKLFDEKISLGFTFSFPITQNSLHSGVLVSWTKSYKCTDVVGKDVVQLLKKSLEKRGCYNVTINAILNDTTGTLMMGALLDKKTAIGLIIGTGSNACYVEKAKKVEHFNTVRNHEKEVIINIEWGAFGDNGVLDFMKTEFDVQVDENSLLTGSFTFEKYISGKYLGEVARVVMVKLITKGLLFGGVLTEPLNTPYLFSSEFVSKIEEDIANDKLNNTLAIMDRFEVRNYSADDVKVLQYVCTVVANRSALLVAICLSVLLERINKKEVTIAVDGSVFEKHPSYRFTLEKYLKLLTHKKFKLLRVTDGSGKGAALAVAIDKRYKDSS